MSDDRIMNIIIELPWDHEVDLMIFIKFVWPESDYTIQLEVYYNLTNIN